MFKPKEQIEDISVNGGPPLQVEEPKEPKEKISKQEAKNMFEKFDYIMDEEANNRLKKHFGSRKKSKKFNFYINLIKL